MNRTRLPSVRVIHLCRGSPFTPTAHWLEWLDVASPILQRPLRIEQGQAVIPETPGVGLEWDEDAVRRFLVD